MTILQAFVLGIVQGLTEFIPVSSSGHLVLVPWLLRWDFESQSAFVFDVLVQWGTLLALIIYFRNDIVSLVGAVISGLKNREDQSNPDLRLAWLILLSTFPALFIGLLLKSLVENVIDSPQWVSIFLLITGGTLFIAEKLGEGIRTITDMSGGDAIWIGFFQLFSLFPGISRSGATISAGLLRGVKRKDAARFSFLMALPIMIAAGIIALIDLIKLPNPAAEIGPLLIGFFVAAVVGYFSIHWLLKFLSERSLNVFAGYCVLAGLLGLLAVALNA
jgi:undecaprenyl-diphosphatase